MRKRKREVFALVKEYGTQGVRAEVIARRIGLSCERVRFSLRGLRSDGLIRKKPDWSDMRRLKHFYPKPFVVFRIVEDNEPELIKEMTCEPIMR